MGRIREGPLRPHVRPLLCGLLGLLPSLGHANMVPMSGQAGQKKQVAVDIHSMGDRSVATLDVVDGGTSTTLSGRAGYQRTDFTLRVATGRGAELYLVSTAGLGLRWSVLDERRKPMPVSLALALEGGSVMPRRSKLPGHGESPYWASALQLSRDVPLQGDLILRPLLNVWYHHGAATQWGVSTADGVSSTTAGPSQFDAFIDRNQPQVLLPVGVDLVVAVTEKRTLSLYGGWTVQQAVGTGQATVTTCKQCTFVADNLQLEQRSAWFVGVRTEGRAPESAP